MKAFLTLIFCCLMSLCHSLIYAQESTFTAIVDVSSTEGESIPFYSGLEGYTSFRIPTLIKTKKTLIAFAEARKNSTSDFGDIDIVCRRSTNQGRSWLPLQILYDIDTMAVQNPVPIYVAEEDKVVLLFNTTTQSEHDILYKDYPLEEERKAFIVSSLDQGKSWSDARDITAQVKLEQWRWHALGPVHGIELKYGINKGRLLAPVAISIEKGIKAYCMALVYSDDHGTSWHIGAVDTVLTDAIRANETTIAELSDGSIYINTRDQNGGSLEKNRGEVYSFDGGITFSDPIVESEKFPSPVVQCSLLSWTGKKYKDLILFATPSNRYKRENLIIMGSIDKAQNWKTLFKVHHGFSAYSDMQQLNKNSLGVIYETDDYKKIRFKRVSMRLLNKAF